MKQLEPILHQNKTTINEKNIYMSGNSWNRYDCSGKKMDCR
jgi:hypothetical protein